MANPIASRINGGMMTFQTSVTQIPATLNHGMKKFVGHLILVPGKLYFICDKSKNLTADLIVSTLTKNEHRMANEIQRDMDSMKDINKEALVQLDELAQSSPDSFTATAKDIGYIKRSFLGVTSMTVRSQKFALLYPGIAKEFRPTVKAWCVAHDVTHKGLG